jgi:type III secretory pathway component EscV
MDSRKDPVSKEYDIIDGTHDGLTLSAFGDFIIGNEKVKCFYFFQLFDIVQYDEGMTGILE